MPATLVWQRLSTTTPFSHVSPAADARSTLGSNPMPTTTRSASMYSPLSRTTRAEDEFSSMHVTVVAQRIVTPARR
jgi:hypothetical protein